MNEQIAALAAQMNVSYADVLAMVKGISASMEADKISDFYIGNESSRKNLCGAYMAAQVKKMDRIQTDYLTNTQFSRQIQGFVSDSLHAEQSK